jgi:anti-sigma regulatory factor (Ser/Thr protein kinase)
MGRLAAIRVGCPASRRRPALHVIRGHVVEDTLVLSPDLHAPARARAWARAQIIDDTVDRADDALLIVSELVTNAVRHAGTDVVLTVGVDAERIRIQVSDWGDELPHVKPGSSDGTRPGGRGLVIVSAVATAWGVNSSRERPGKTVWADLALSSYE